MKELYCEYNGYRQLILKLEKKYSEREQIINKLFESGDTKAIQRRVESIRAKVKKALTDEALYDGKFEIINAGTIIEKGYSIEKVLLNASGHFSIPVNVYVPQGNGEKRHPAILHPIGHCPEGKKHADTQRLLANFAMHGIICATFDPVCQGERALLPDTAIKEWFTGVPDDLRAVAMHGQLGNIAYIRGKNNAAIFIRDAKIVLDYLCSRSDVDSNNIGCTGHSGGGTQTNFISSIDDRIKYVSPVQCMSKMRAVLPEGIGDSEQSLLGISADEGFDYADQAWACFPKPYLLSIAINDQFPYEGAKEAEEELRKLYSITGHSDSFEVAFSVSRHKNCYESRMAAYSFFYKHMLGSKEPVSEIDINILDEELNCANGKTNELPQADYLTAVKNLLNKASSSSGNIRSKLTALICEKENQRFAQWDADVDAFFKSTDTKVAVYIGPDREITSHITGNVIIVTPWGMDSTYDKEIPIYDAESCTAYAANVYGFNVCRERVQEVLKVVVEYAAKGYELSLIGEGAGSIVALYAGCISRCKTILIDVYKNYKELFDEDVYFIPETNVLDGVLEVGDTSDIIAASDVILTSKTDLGLLFS